MEVKQINWEYALHDVMGNICKYLNAKALCNLAKVSKSWRVAVLNETSRRCYIQQLSICNECDNLDSMLYVNPYVSLFIYDGRMVNYLIERKIDVLEHFKKKLPHKKLMLIFVPYLTTEYDMKSLNDFVPLTTKGDLMRFTWISKYNFLGLFFPNLGQQVNVHLAWASDISGGTYQMDKMDSLVDSFADDLGLTNSERPKSIILLFTSMCETFAGWFVNYLKSRIQTGKDAICVCLVSKGYLYSFKSNEDHTGRGIMALRISGPRIEYWTSIMRTSDLSCFEQKLQELKEKVTAKRHHYTGLMYASNDTLEQFTNPKLMGSVQRIFPDIPFIGLIDSYGYERIITEYAPKPVNLAEDTLFDSYLSLIIISYN